METRPQNIERWIGLCLRFGVWGSAALMASGLAITAIQHGVAPTTANPTLKELWSELISGSVNGHIVMSSGLVLLMFTPFLRVLTALAGFLAEKDTKFAAIAMLILLMLAGELIYSVR